MTPYLILLIAATVAATSYFSALNLAMVQASRSGLENELDARGALDGGRFLLGRLHEASHAVAFFRTVGRVTLFALVLVAFEGFGETARISLAGLAGTVVVSVALVWLFTSVLSSAIARHATYGIIASSLGFVRLSLVVVGPILAAVGFIDEVVRRLTGRTSARTRPRRSSSTRSRTSSARARSTPSQRRSSRTRSASARPRSRA